MMNDVFHEYWMILWFVTLMTSDFLKKMVDHEHHVHIVLGKLQEIGLYAKLEKSGFHQFEVEFLGCIIFADSVGMDLRNVQTTVDWATPAFVRDVQYFFRFANFYQ
jgi:hypothetical protein